MNGKTISALLDRGSPNTLIDPQVVEQNQIPYRNKKIPKKLGSFKGETMTYGGGYMRLETEVVNLEVSKIHNRRNISITKLGDLDMIIGYNWLYDHDPLISHHKGTVLPNPEIVTAVTKAGQRRPMKQSSTQDGCFSKISLHKIIRIYKKNPQRVQAIIIRQVDARQSGPIGNHKTPEKDDVWENVPKEYQTNEFRELFEENEATDLPQHQE